MEQFNDIIVHYGALGVFFASLIEEVIVPIPSALIMMAAGFFLLGTQAISVTSLVFLFTNVALPIALGLTLGSLVTYGLAYYLGKPFVERWGNYLSVTWTDIERLESYFAKQYKDELVFFGLRLVPIVPSIVINLFAGFVRFPIFKYLILTFVGILFRAYLVGFLGWQIGEAFYNYDTYFNQVENLGLIVVVIIAAFFFFKKRKKNQVISNQ